MLSLRFFFLFFLIQSLCGCNRDHQTLSKQNFHAERLHRYEQQTRFIPPLPKKLSLSTYPWNCRKSGDFRKITKEFFRCKGSSKNPPRFIPREGKEALVLRDCMGDHGLPLEEGKEYIFPCLIELLNFIQDQTKSAVVITSGHRCPQHNRYCDESKAAWGSKHQMAAEVDFYLKDKDISFSEMLSLLSRFYCEHIDFKEKKEFTEFKKYEKAAEGTSNPAYYNKEIFLKVFSSHEGRNCDNCHNHPYFTLQARYDRERNCALVFNSAYAENFQRY